MASAQQQARAWNPEFKHSDRERWICIYPCYLNNKKTRVEGRRIVKDKCVENPTYGEIRDVCAAAGMVLGVENKVHPRERDVRDQKSRGRIRIQLKNDDGTPMLEKYPTRDSVLLYLGETIPKLKTRQQGQGGGQGQSQAQGGGSSRKKKPKKK